MAGPIRISHVEPFPPLAELKNGRSEGLAVDIVRAAAARAGIEVEFVGLPLEQFRAALRDGRADAIFLGVAPENLSIFDFSAPVLTTAGALYVRAPAPEPESLAAMDGKIVVTPRAGPLAEYIKTNAPSVKVVLTTDYEDSLTRVMHARLRQPRSTIMWARSSPLGYSPANSPCHAACSGRFRKQLGCRKANVPRSCPA
jgi:polar amino acid transport system substrate-binding protein